MTNPPPKTVVFEESHNETWTVEKYRAFVNSYSRPEYYSYAHLKDALDLHLNYQCGRNIKWPVSSGLLRDCDLLIIAHPAAPDVHKGVGGNPMFSEEEVSCIKQYVIEGGALLVLNEYKTSIWKNNLNELLEPFNLRFNNDIVEASFETIEGWSVTSQFSTNRIGDHDICRGVSSVSYYAGCSVDGYGEEPFDALVYGPQDSTLALAKRVGKGRVCLVGDSDIFAHPYIHEFDNLRFFLNMTQWLIGETEICQFQHRTSKNILSYKPSIFLSYAREDEEIVHKVYDTLTSYGCRPWLDTKSIKTGESYQKSIQLAIKDCDFFMFFISNNSIGKRGFLQRELRIAFAMAEEFLDSDIFILPIRVHPIDPPKVLQRYQWLNTWELGFSDRMIGAIIEGLKRRTNNEI